MVAYLYFLTDCIQHVKVINASPTPNQSVQVPPRVVQALQCFSHCLEMSLWAFTWITTYLNSLHNTAILSLLYRENDRSHNYFDLETFVHWFDAKHLILNVKKTEEIAFGVWGNVCICYRHSMITSQYTYNLGLPVLFRPPWRSWGRMNTSPFNLGTSSLCSEEHREHWLWSISCPPLWVRVFTLWQTIESTQVATQSLKKLICAFFY